MGTNSGSTAKSLLSCFLLLELYLASAQTETGPTQPSTPTGGEEDTERGMLGDEVVIAALVVGVVGCVGVATLSIIVVCLLMRMRKERKKWAVSDGVPGVEKAPMSASGVPLQDITKAGNNSDQTTMRQSNVCVGVGTLRQVSLSLLQDLLLNLYNVSVKRADHSPPKTSTSPGRKDSEQLTVTSAGADEVQKQLTNALVKIFHRDRARVETFLSLGQAIMTATTVRQLSDSTFRVMRVCLGVVREWGVASEDYVGVIPTEGQGHVSVVVEDEVNSLSVTWDGHKFSPQLLTSVSMISQALRDERRQPTPEEYLALQLAYYALGKGQQISDIRHRPLSSPGFHPHVQTQLALTDSGYGHLLGTTRRSDWLQGVVVHVQHIGSLADEDLAPSLFDLGKVRLHVGESAPTTFFVSRRLGHVSSGEIIPPQVWEAELSKLVQLTANSISAAFYHGAAACHVSMAGLTTSQAATFMSQLRPHVQRERHLQALVAVWDLATPLTDDYEVVEGQGQGQAPKPVGSESPVVKKSKVIDDPYHIARRSIDITLVGGFDQVTWFSSCDVPNTAAASTNTDDTSDTSNKSEKATCVIRRLTSQQLVTLVHQAHARGLMTYFAGGVTCQDIQPAVMAGADGVAVGGVGMLHHAQIGRNNNERHGPYMEENIPQVLACRDEASKISLGQAAHLLSRLDTMFFEGSLASAENALRRQLFNALIDKDNNIIRSVLTKFEDVMQLPSEQGHPLMGTARRLAARKTPALKDVAESAYEWAMFITRLKTLVNRGDENGVVEEYGGEPWHTYRKKYREHREGPHGFFRQVSFQVELKTDF